MEGPETKYQKTAVFVNITWRSKSKATGVRRADMIVF